MLHKNSFDKLMTVEEALSIINDIYPYPPKKKEILPIYNSLGRVLAENTISKLSHPSEDVSSMDGYAIRFYDFENNFKLQIRQETSTAGGKIPYPLKSEEAVRIFTGAPLPNGADTIVLQEDADIEEDGSFINCLETAKCIKGLWIRKKGSDFLRNQTVIEAPKLLNYSDISMLAAMNYPFLEVYVKPTVSIIATGNELILPGETDPEQSPSEGNKNSNQKLVSSNTFGLKAMLDGLGARTQICKIVKDDIKVLKSAIFSCLGSDLIITTGGASYGDHDLIEDAIHECKGQFHIRGVSMKPGKPFSLASIEGSIIACLPGNPISSLLCARIMLKPLVKRMVGVKEYNDPVKFMKLAKPMGKNGSRTHFMRAFVNNKSDQNLHSVMKKSSASRETVTSQEHNGERKEGLLVHPFEDQDSAMLSIMQKSNAIIVRPANDSAKEAGDWVVTLRL